MRASRHDSRYVDGALRRPSPFRALEPPLDVGFELDRRQRVSHSNIRDAMAHICGKSKSVIISLGGWNRHLITWRESNLTWDVDSKPLVFSYVYFKFPNFQINLTRDQFDRGVHSIDTTCSTSGKYFFSIVNASSLCLLDFPLYRI